MQDNQHEEAMAFMDAVGLRYQPSDLGIRREDLMASLLNLRQYVSGRRELWHTVINEREISPAWADRALATLKF